MEVSLGGVEQDGWVHQGMFAAATYVQCSTQVSRASSWVGPLWLLWALVDGAACGAAQCLRLRT